MSDAHNTKGNIRPDESDDSGPRPLGKRLVQVLKNRYVLTVIFSRVCLHLGIWIRNFAILLYVTELTNNNPVYVSVISIAEYAPIFVFAVIGGTFADRWLPKRTMIWCDVLSGLSAFVVLLTLGTGSWYGLLLATLVSAILSQFSQPSAMKLFKQHVPEEQLQGVMAMFQSLTAIFMVIGPVVGTFVYQQYGIVVSMLLMGGLLFSSALILAQLPKDTTERAAARYDSFIHELKAGLRYVWSSSVLRTLGVVFAFTGLASGLIQPLSIFVVMENLGLDKSALKWFMMANGAAMLLGGAWLMGMSGKIRPQTLLAVGLLFSTIGTLGTGWSHSVPLTIVLQMLNGLGFPCIHIGINTLLLRNTEAGFVGRVGGTLMPVFTGLTVIGMSISGLLKVSFSLMGVFATASFLFLVAALWLIPLVRDKDKGIRSSVSQP